ELEFGQFESSASRSRRAVADLCGRGGGDSLARAPIGGESSPAGRGLPGAGAPRFHREGDGPGAGLRPGGPVLRAPAVGARRGGTGRPRRCQPDPVGPGICESSLAGGGAGGARQREAAVLEPVPAGGKSAAGHGTGGRLHPSTWIGIFLPVALSWTFSCTFTIFLALLAAFLFFHDFGLRPAPALVGAVGWGFSTYVLFWDGWSVGPAIATLPLLLLCLRRI